jgi:pimeloyl-ACP methyl ester carboxylesterase
MAHIVFIHGMFMTGASWSQWESFFQERGFTTSAPNWPGRERKPRELRDNPDPKLGELELGHLLALYRDEVRKHDEPLLIGHSMGGLLVQLLLGEGLGAAGVAIHSAPPKGVVSFAWSFLKSNAATFWPSSAPIRPTLDWWIYAFAHTLPREQAAADFDRYVVPESRRVGRGPTTDTAKIDFGAQRAPLLMIAGELDHIIPASLNKKNFARYAESPATTDFHEFEGRTHWTCGMQGWEEVATKAADWLTEHASN